MLIDGKSDNTTKVMSVLIDKGTIIDLLDGYVDPGTGDTAIDLNNYTATWFNGYAHPFIRRIESQEVYGAFHFGS